MTDTLIEITEDEFDRQYSLVVNHLNPHASWAFGDSTRGCLFETFGPEFEIVRHYDPRKVWTLIDGEDGDMYVISGRHFVNRIGYLLSREPVPDNTVIQVHVPMSDDGELLP